MAPGETSDHTRHAHAGASEGAKDKGGARADAEAGARGDENTSQHTAVTRDARDAASEKSVSKRRRAIFKRVDTGRVLIN